MLGDSAGYFFDTSEDALKTVTRTFLSGRGVYFNAVPKTLSSGEQIPGYVAICNMHSSTVGQRSPTDT